VAGENLMANLLQLYKIKMISEYEIHSKN